MIVQVIPLDRDHLRTVPRPGIPFEGLAVHLQEPVAPGINGEDLLGLLPLPEDEEGGREGLEGGELEGLPEVHRVRREEEGEGPPAPEAPDGGGVEDST